MTLFVDGLNNFAFDLFKNVHSDKVDVGENTVISSISVFVAMLMTLAGAKSNTRNELIKSLRVDTFLSNQQNLTDYDDRLTVLHESIHSLVKLITENDDLEDKSNRVLIANKMVLKNQNIEESFRKMIESNYHAKIDLITTEESFKSVVAETNKWISDLTNKKIENILDDSFKTASLALINAIYFNYEWFYQFDEKKTKKHDFYLSKDRSNIAQVDMMELSDKRLLYYYSQSLNSHLVSLPYKKEKFSFNILLSTNENDFLQSNDQTSLINRLSYDLVKTEMQNQAFESINLSIPKFVIKKKIQLNTILKQLGIESAFDSKEADFSGISATDKLFIQEVLQYSYIEVNEKGTEAAAATVVKMVKRSISPTIHIKLDRPFVYFISEKSTGAILFCGSFNGMVEHEKVDLGEKTEL